MKAIVIIVELGALAVVVNLIANAVILISSLAQTIANFPVH